MQHWTLKMHAAVFSLNGLPFSAVSPDKCLGVPALQSFHSRTHSDGAVQRFAVHTSINARKQYIQTNKFGLIVCQHCWCANCCGFNVAETGDVQQPTRAENTAEPNKALAFSAVFRPLSPLSVKHVVWLQFESFFFPVCQGQQELGIQDD